MMRRLRGSSASSACSRPAARPSSDSLASSCVQRLGVAVGGEVVHRRIGRLVVIAVGLECDVLAGEARFHLDHFLGLDAQLARHALDVLALIVARPFFIERRLKNSLRCALVVASFTSRQLRRMYSWISALIQWMANDTRRTLRSGSKRLTAFIRPIEPSWMRSACGRP